MITDYDCRNAYIMVDKVDYLLEFEKADQCFKSAENLVIIGDFENAYIILYRGLQFIGNGVLIKKFGLNNT